MRHAASLPTEPSVASFTVACAHASLPAWQSPTLMEKFLRKGAEDGNREVRRVRARRPACFWDSEFTIDLDSVDASAAVRGATTRTSPLSGGGGGGGGRRR